MEDDNIAGYGFTRCEGCRGTGKRELGQRRRNRRRLAIVFQKARKLHTCRFSSQAAAPHFLHQSTTKMSAAAQGASKDHFVAEERASNPDLGLYLTRTRAKEHPFLVGHARYLNVTKELR